MPLSLVTNIASLRAQTQVNRTTQALGETFERLSSGLRINSASDDPAGLALADKLRTETKVATVAIRNANDGLSLTAVADSGLSEIQNILSRMSELAQQSANGTYTNSQRSALASEFLALGSEIQRIASTTTYNNINLLSGSSNITIQVGFNSSSLSSITLTSAVGTLMSLGIGNSGGSLTYSIIDISTTGSQTSALRAFSAISNAIDSIGVVRGALGASESRLSSAINYLTVLRENLGAAESRIRDADIAQEVAAMIRLQVLQQSGMAVLAQANQQPSRVLALLS